VKFTDTLRGLWRRWYIVVPGFLVAASVAIGAFFVISPGYERSATQLLIPGADSMPVGANPYLFLGGLAPTADVLVRAVGSENALNELIDKHPGAEIKVMRDTTTAGPVILITVTAPSDSAAREVLGQLVDRTATTLNDLQVTENIALKNRVTVLPITVDDKSVVQQRTRLLGAWAAGIAGVLLTLLVAGYVDGMSLQRRLRKASTTSSMDVGDPLDQSRYDDAPTPVASDAVNAR
jgi:capsular polysaccharide biosynthesis protein